LICSISCLGFINCKKDSNPNLNACPKPQKNHSKNFNDGNKRQKEIRKDTGIWKKTEVLFNAICFLFSGWMYVLLGSTVPQLFIIMYILFFIFSNFTRQDPKKLYINMWVELYFILLSSTSDVNVLQVPLLCILWMNVFM
jgi:hypothetical protein